MGLFRLLKNLWTYVPLSRKSLLSVFILGGMGLALVSLEHPYGVGTFSFGSLVLGSDYKILKIVGLDGCYHWIESRDTIHTEIERNYQAKKFIEEGPDRLDLHPRSEGNLRSMVPATDYVFEGMPFRIYVEAPSTGTTEDLQYHLQVASAELTRLSETSGSGATAFFTITDWNDSFEDDEETERASNIQRRLRQGDDEISPFAKVKVSERVNEFELDEWRAIYDWSKHTVD